ncbi:MAG: SOS response-associated peptidase family protein [Terracidiphilus sp.]
MVSVRRTPICRHGVRICGDSVLSGPLLVNYESVRPTVALLFLGRIPSKVEIVCGRYGKRADKQRIAEWMQTHDTNVFDDSHLAPSYNVAPQSFQPVVKLDGENRERELTLMRWGLVPFWTLFRKSPLLSLPKISSSF